MTRCISFSLPNQSVLNERSVVSRPGQDRDSSLFPESLQPCRSRQGLDRFTSYAGISIRLAERGLAITHRGTALMEAGHGEELLPFPSRRNSLSLEPFIRTRYIGPQSKGHLSRLFLSKGHCCLQALNSCVRHCKCLEKSLSGSSVLLKSQIISQVFHLDCFLFLCHQKKTAG